MARKDDLVNVLNVAGLGSKTSLKKLGVEELEKMVAELPDEIEVVNPEYTLDNEEVLVDIPDEVAVDGVVSIEVLEESQHQLGIFTEFIYHVKNEGAKVVIENLGGGDVYTNGKGSAKVGVKEQRLTFGTKGELLSNRVSLVAASQPVVKITEVK